MKHPLNLEDLYAFLDRQRRPLLKEQQDKFGLYLGLLRQWSQKHNLVSNKDIPHIAERHFLPSLLFDKCIVRKNNLRVIDFGSGAGFPGVVLKILRPGLSVTLLDSSRKKVLFLEEVCEVLNLDCTIVCQRSEDYQLENLKKFNIVVSRAVARLDILWRWCESLIASNGILCTLKGGNCQQEIDDLRNRKLHIEFWRPEKDWIKFSSYLNDKCMVIMEK